MTAWILKKVNNQCAETDDRIQGVKNKQKEVNWTGQVSTMREKYTKKLTHMASACWQCVPEDTQT